MKFLFQIMILPIILLLTLLSCNQNADMNKIDSTIQKIKIKYAPDKRVALFDISAYKNKNEIIITGETNIPEGLKELMNEFQKEEFELRNEVNILPDKDLGERKFGIVNLSVANLRSEPKHPAELVTQALLGTVVNVLKKKDGWYLVQTPDKYIAWVDDDGIKLSNSEEIDIWKNSEKIIMTQNYGTVYSLPNSQSQIISDLVLGSLLKTLNDFGAYASVEFPDGRQGYVRKSNTLNYLEWIQQIEPDQNSIINSAEQFMGLPYLWGGTSSKGFDCSGFTKTVYYINGVIIPRDASQQVNIGREINTQNGFSNLQKGDLLFFGSKATENSEEKITHVGIYMGDMKYIHSSGRVRVNSLDKNDEDFNKYRYDTFIRAKRIIGYYDRGDNLVSNNSFY